MLRTIEQGGAYSKSEILQYVQKSKPLTLSDLQKYTKLPSLYEKPYTVMNEYEKGIAELLLKRGLVVYREIPIGESGSSADFYVYNPKSKKGKLVEVTLIKRYYKAGDKLPSIKTKNRKDRQLELLQATGMPFVVLYQENLVSIRKYFDKHLF